MAGPFEGGAGAFSALDVARLFNFLSDHAYYDLVVADDGYTMRQLVMDLAKIADAMDGDAETYPPLGDV